ncbi:MAG: hypothetical protein ACNA8K_00140 [Cyclonatronaceae bacterium]
MINDDDEFENDGNPDEPSGSKKILIGFLVAACLAAGLLLMQGPVASDPALASLDTVDSLLSRELAYFNIPPNRIRITSEQAGGVFERKTYTIDVPSGFNKTYFHMELARRLMPVQIDLSGVIEFPDRILRLILLYENTVIRTIRINPVSEYDLPTYPARMMLAFNSRPGAGLAATINRETPGMPIALRVGSAEDAVAWSSNFKSHPLFFMMDASLEELPVLARSLRSVASRPRFLLMDASQMNIRGEIMQAAGRNAGWIDGQNAVIISDKAGRMKLEQDLARFFRESRAGSNEFALIEVSDSGFEWLAEKLHDYRKGGMVITSPVVRLP